MTNAKLYACAADPSTISLDEGKITGAMFVPLRYVRFRKSLALGLTEGMKKVRTVGEADENRERTVFVVNAEHLITVLTEWKVQPIDGENWPHEELAALARFGG